MNYGSYPTLYGFALPALFCKGKLLLFAQSPFVPSKVKEGVSANFKKLVKDKKDIFIFISINLNTAIMDIKQKEISFRLMVDASPIALILVNTFGKIAFLNNHAASLFLYRKNELADRDIGILLSESNHSDFKDLLKEYFVNPVSPQIHKNREFYAMKKDGVEFPVEIGLNPIIAGEGTMVLAAVIDITERKQADEQFRLVVESAPDAMILVDVAGEIVMINKQTEKLFGYRRDELMGKNVEMLVPERLKIKHPQLRESFNASPQARPMGAGRDLFAVKKDGTEIPVEIGLNPIEKSGAKFILASIIDITWRKKNEEAIRLYTKRIEDKNKELEQFTYIASHDLREPLNSINGLIALLFNDSINKLDDETKVRLEFISKSANRMTNLVKGLLDYARLGKNSALKKIDLNHTLKLVLDDLEGSISKTKAKIKVDKLPVIKALEMEIRLLFQNLISNAIKYRKPDIEPEINISAKKVKSGWEFAVKDNGIGIPPKQKEKIFIIFQRLHNRNEYEGIGIGLAHCRKIAELHDGKIWVESELNRGSTFYFFIPSK